MSASLPKLLYDNRFSDGTVTATDTAAGFFAAAISDWRGYTFWIAASAGQKYLTVDCATAKLADTLCLFGHNLFTANASVTVDSSTNGSSWTTRRIAFTPADDRALLVAITPASARYWRIGINTATIPAQVAVACLGVAVELPSYPDAPYATYDEEAVFERGRSKAGHTLGVVCNYVSEALSPVFSVVLKSWVDTYFKPFWRNHVRYGLPFFYAGNGDGAGTDVHFVCMSDKYNFRLTQSDSLYVDQLPLQMEGVIE